MAKSNTLQQHIQAKKNVSLIAAITNILLAVGKTVCGIISQSEALIADGIHSFSDLLTDLITIVAVKIAAQGADADHPYGHQRFETLATVILGMILMVTGAGVLVSASHRLQHPSDSLIPGSLALGMALLSIIANELLYRYSMHIAKQTRSKLIEANAWHHRSDSISSIVVLIGLLATIYGYPIADAIAAALVAVMIAKIGYELIYTSIQELVDKALPESQLAAMRASIIDTDGVADLHMLRSRRMGSEALADVHILVHPKISVSEAHMIGDNVSNRLQEQFEGLSDVLVHIDPEDDTEENGKENCQALPQRSTILSQIKNKIEQLSWPQSLDSVNLHYLNGCVEIDLILPRQQILDDEATQTQVESALQQAITEINFVSRLKVYYS